MAEWLHVYISAPGNTCRKFLGVLQELTLFYKLHLRLTPGSYFPPRGCFFACSASRRQAETMRGVRDGLARAEQLAGREEDRLTAAVHEVSERG